MLNTVVLMGRLTADPELRHTSNNIAVTSFTLAVNRSYTKNGAERATDFIDVVAWRNTAEFVSKYFSKGQLVAVQGSIQTRTYQDKDGNKRKAFEVVADNVHFAESKRDNSSNSERAESDSFESHSSITPSSFEVGSPDDFKELPTDDDLPF
ncbi:MAG: Single-stranded DNA-binding protein [Eubacteriales bacterium SKADARSKE-1]|nr:Single-stranded DNA-binding protein [Eubacteriales bacterium SKADARSKE-1]